MLQAMPGKAVTKNFAGAMPTGHLLQQRQVATVPSWLQKLLQLQLQLPRLLLQLLHQLQKLLLQSQPLHQLLLPK